MADYGTQPVREEDVHFLSDLMSQCSEVNKNKEQLYGALNLPQGKLNDLIQKYMFNSYSFIREILKIWIEKFGTKAVISLLDQALRSIGSNNTADDIKGKWFNRSSHGNFSLMNALPIQIKKYIWFNIKEPIGSFTGRITILKQILDTLKSNTNSNKRITVISTIVGLGGIGKTELARKFAYDYAPQEFDGNAIWIDAENEEQLRNSFQTLVDEEELGIKQGREIPIKRLVKNVYEHFHNCKSLFIFDNVQSWKSGVHAIYNYLPTNLFPNCQRPYILMTSRNQNWGNEVKMIPIQVLELTEAVELIQKILKLDTNSQLEMKAANKLANILGCLPLALQQAIAYILEELVEEKRRVTSNLLPENYNVYYIESYCDKINNETSALLNYTDEKKFGDDYEKTTFLTWKVTLDKINETNNEAIQLMIIFSYFGSDKIPAQIFLNNDMVTQNILDKAISILIQYSMITKDSPNSVSVHRLVQQVIRLNNKENEENTLRCILTLFQNQVLKNMELDCQLLISCITQAQIVWEHSLKHSNLVNEFRKFPITLFDTGSRFGMYETNLTLMMNTYEEYKKYFNILDKINIKVKICIGSAYRSLQKYEEARNTAETLYPLVVSEYGENHSLAIRLLTGMANAISNQGNYLHALSIYNKLIEQQIRCLKLGPTHRSTIVLYHNKAFTLESLGRDDEALELLRSTHDIETKIKPMDPLLILQTETSIAYILQKNGSNEEALNMYENIYLKRKEIYGENHAFTLRSVVGVGICLSRIGKHEEGLDILNKNLDLAMNNPNCRNTYLKMKYEIGKILIVLKKYEDAVYCLETTLKEQEDLIGEIHPDVLKTKYELGLLFKVLDRKEDALHLIKYVHELRLQQLGLDHPDTVSSQISLLKITGCVCDQNISTM